MKDWAFTEDGALQVAHEEADRLASGQAKVAGLAAQGAALAIAVRDHLDSDDFLTLYGPFIAHIGAPEEFEK